jgi:hypothetical protein
LNTFFTALKAFIRISLNAINEFKTLNPEGLNNINTVVQATEVECMKYLNVPENYNVFNLVTKNDLEAIKNIYGALTVHTYIDASFAVHHDMRSHSGCFISIGLGPIYVKSTNYFCNYLCRAVM